jgi:hypothetical protein
MNIINGATYAYVLLALGVNCIKVNKQKQDTNVEVAVAT